MVAKTRQFLHLEGRGGIDWHERCFREDLQSATPSRAVNDIDPAIQSNLTMKSIPKHWRALLLPFTISFFTSVASAQETAEEAATALSAGDTAWMIVATCLVLFMTLPGLALFYGGLVRTKNILSILVQCFVIAAVMSTLWFAYGYSFALSGGNE